MRRRVVQGYLFGLVLLVALCVSWVALNKFRVHYYNDSIEGSREASRYWPVVKTQHVLQWPIGVITVCLFGAGVYEIARWFASRLED
jgi:hypothetical protein